MNTLLAGFEVAAGQLHSRRGRALFESIDALRDAFALESALA